MSINIQTIKSNNNAPAFKGASPKTFMIKSEKAQNVVKWLGERSTPENRFFLGVAAIALQPMIDLNNKDVDEKTRKVSCARTIAKAIAGTAVGVAVRYACIKSIDALTLTPKELEKSGKKVTDWNQALIPTKIDRKIYGEAERLVKKHRQTIGSVLALGVMLITNFALDVPITKYLTNVFMDKFEQADNKKSAQKGGKS